MKNFYRKKSSREVRFGSDRMNGKVFRFEGAEAYIEIAKCACSTYIAFVSSCVKQSIVIAGWECFIRKGRGVDKYD